MTRSSALRRRPLLRSVVRGFATAASLLLAMLVVLALEGRLDEFGALLRLAPGGTGSAQPPPPPSAAALRSIAASTPYFLLPAPLDAGALQELERQLVESRERTAAREEELERRHLDLEVREGVVRAREERLELLEADLLRLARELELGRAEHERERAAFAALGERARRELAWTLAEMDPAKAAEVLMAQTELETAAALWLELPADVRAAVGEQLDAETGERFWPIVVRLQHARTAERERNARSRR